jgi:hypothetical protein
MRAHGLPAPRRLGPPNGDPAHAGTIITDRPDVMWGTDATRFYTEQDGWCWFFGAIDHHLDELLGWHAVKLGDRRAEQALGVPLVRARPGKGRRRGTVLTADGRCLVTMLGEARERVDRTIGATGPTREEIEARGRRRAQRRPGTGGHA